MLKSADFRLLPGAGDLGDHQLGNRTSHHEYCRRCGVHTFIRGHADSFGDYVSAQLATLDDASDAELAAAPVHCADGRNDQWARPPAETRHLRAPS